MNNDIVMQALAKLSRKKLEDIQPHVSLRTLGLNSSFGLSALRSLLEAKSSVKLPPLHLTMSVDEVIRLLLPGEPVSANTTTLLRQVVSNGSIGRESPAENFAGPIDSPGASSGIGLGMDMQETGSFEAVVDYRTDPFYTAHFAHTEIATAILKPDPIAHFAGVFCAKEAAKKSRNDLLSLQMRDFLLTHSAAGKPILKLVDGHSMSGRFQFMVSITHTERYAAATCLTFGR
jgi:holo-[acyl-carrier protein] synthase